MGGESTLAGPSIGQRLEAEQTTTAEDLKALEALVVDNKDLESLEAQLSQFNLFEAIGAVRRELRHSDVLAFLLDPNQSHGLGSHFLRRLLQRALASASPISSPISPVWLDVSELDEVDVRREWRNIDILIIDKRNRLSVILENKIDSDEHSEQLGRYWNNVRAEHPEHGIIGLYLTPDGDRPSDERYIAISYTLIAVLVDEVLTTRSSIIGADVRVLLSHYVQLLRRHIVSDSEIADLCRRIYRRHRRAIDLILEYRPDLQQNIRETLEKIITDTPGLVLDECSKRYIRFAPVQWDIPSLREGSGWTKSGRILLFEFQNQPERLVLKLYVGPGPTATREKCHEVALADPKLFVKASKSLREKWAQLYVCDFLGSKDFEDDNPDSYIGLVHTRWDNFTRNSLPAILTAMNSLAA